MLYLVFALIALLSACLGQQQDCMTADVKARLMFVESDMNGDGVVRIWEFIDNFRKNDNFFRPDAIVTRTEYVEHQTSLDPGLEGVYNELFNVFDIDSDDRMTMNDYNSVYWHMDMDGDESVTEPEFTTYWTKLFNSVKHHTNLIC